MKRLDGLAADALLIFACAGIVITLLVVGGYLAWQVIAYVCGV